MNRFLLVLFTAIYPLASMAQGDSLLSGFNQSFYASVLPAARGVAMPFLLQQGYLSMTGVSVADSAIIYDGIRYNVHESYLNPAAGYYISPSLYSDYGISGFASIWPGQFPDIVFRAADTSFDAQSDCVGYLTRLLSATGDTSVYGNAYLNLISATHSANKVPFAYRGYVATAYSFAVAFPTLPAVVTTGWQYIAGAIEPAEIDTYNHTKVSTLGTYDGVRRGGFGQAKAGDVLAFGYAASASSNGHIMVMETAPQLLSADSLASYFPPQTLAEAVALLGRRHIYSVPVYDCSGQMAHFRDSRIQHSGIGHGTLLILTDPADDAPVGFIFDSTQVTYSTIHMDTLGSSVYAISVGRYVTADPSGIRDMDLSAPLVGVSPNPGSHDLHISLPDTGGEILIYTADGRLMLRQSVYAASISVETESWADELYTIVYKDGNGTIHSTRWIKQ